MTVKGRKEDKETFGSCRRIKPRKVSTFRNDTSKGAGNCPILESGARVPDAIPLTRYGAGEGEVVIFRASALENISWRVRSWLRTNAGGAS